MVGYKVTHYSVSPEGLTLEYNEPYIYKSVGSLSAELKQLGYERINARLYVAVIDGTTYIASYDKVKEETHTEDEK